MYDRSLKNRLTQQRRQGGAALPMVVASLLAMLLISGLTLDVSHALTNKSRLQSTVDAAALAAAKAYDETPDIVAANISALALFGLNADGAGNHELDSAYDAGDITVTLQWSETLNPFVSTGLGPYVRVIATGFSISSSLSVLLGIDTIDVSSTAVAGPSPTINTACNIAPMVACALDPDDLDLFGYAAGSLQVLKHGAAEGACSGQVGCGNFHLIRLDCPGGDCIRENVAGGWNGCISGSETVETEPGNTVGPVVQGLNTRFGEYNGAMSPDVYPPDVVTRVPDPPLGYDDDIKKITQSGTEATSSSIDYGWADYQDDVHDARYTNPPPTGVFERRVLAIPIARCDGTSSGQSTLDVVGFGCYFLSQPVVQKGNEAEIFGQFIQGCTAAGAPGPTPISGPDPYIIQLYKDPGSGDS
jgi:Flp pilus assembly protein TadG